MKDKETGLTNEQKKAVLRHQRRLLARQRKEEGREYMSIIRQDILTVVNEPLVMLKID